MKVFDNTILITGGGSGIGRSPVEAVQAPGHPGIIAGRRGLTAALLVRNAHAT